MPCFAPTRAYGFLTLCSVGLLLIAAGCARNTAYRATDVAQPPATSAVTSATPTTYVGDALCAGCHQAVSREHYKSNHAHTLHTMEPAELGRLAPPAGRLPGLPFALRRTPTGFLIDTYPPSADMQPLDYAFGTGKHGVTYAAVLPENQLLEMRQSYFPRQRQWHTTPGHDKIPRDYAGRTHDPAFSRKCLGCHVVTLPPDTLRPEPRFMGVGCEACHGPASAHVAAMQAASPRHPFADIHIERLRTWGARRINEMCGKCHGTAASVGDSKPNLLRTPRFQPYALMLSRCFQASKDTLSCVTCHNAHQNVSQDTKAYEAACLNCHRPAAKPFGSKLSNTQNLPALSKRTIQPTAATQAAVSPGKVCPVSPQAGCIPCHMPSGRVMPGSMVRSLAPDHYIRVVRPEQEAAQTRLHGRGAASASGNLPEMDTVAP